jgi:hypothetical protein
LAAGRRIRAAAPQTWLALRGGPDAKDLAADGGTESSNPSPSSGESGANSSQVDEVAERFRTFEELGYTDVLVRQQRSAEVSLERLRIRLRS